MPTKSARLAVGGDVLLGQHRPDLAGALPRIVGQRLPHLFLLLRIVGDGEGHQAIEGHLALAVGRDQFRADHGELEPLAHDLRRDAEPGGDLLLALAFVGQFLERVELVGGVHRLAQFVLGEADLGRLRAVAHFARHRIIGGDLLLLGQEFERVEPPASGDDVEAASPDGRTCKFCNRPCAAMLAARPSMPVLVLRTLAGEGTSLVRGMVGCSWSASCRFELRELGTGKGSRSRGGSPSGFQCRSAKRARVRR